ncbi:ShlB/FhaC/HecB family hemolysin secretion/activation protein [Altererythrobacter sp. H2]|uniref:ShlB/FhaC/HecB family hemolysin secretion/activation protein n=1 Tax=Altererythrobacter sp. H2 TaxID=3108391 RepID=UPI002B4BE353|nr:ShlB/FhaC/HecB family hemolysin secretion/activation protein [Altererythrobacter sp. H2]WRK97289.1 ShlB/FhaC/HecB family hemolysin secretion/activation protein [Altererythrobacter sp. H2]
MAAATGPRVAHPKSSHLLSTALVGIALAIPTMPASAQTVPAALVPPTRDELIPPSQIRPQEGPTLTIDGQMERAPCALDRAEYADIRLTLSGVAFGGLDRVPGLSLADSYAGYLGRELPLAALCDIRAKASTALQQQGYLATVEIPEQNLSDGVADFQVVFGRLTALRVRGEAGPSERLVASYLEQLTDEPVFNTRDAERYLLLADDLPGVDVRLSLRPAAGGAPGDLTGEIAVIRRRGSLDLNIQNYGSRAIGRFGGLLRGEIYDITGMGDRTTMALFSTLEFEEQHTVQLGHDFRVGKEGLRFAGAVTYSVTNPDIGLPGFDVKSETLLASIQASYPLRRSRTASVAADFGFDYVDQDVDVNRILLTRDRVRTLFARVAGEFTDAASVSRVDGYSAYEPRKRFRFALEGRHGIDIFGASPDCRVNPLGCIVGGQAPPSRIEADSTPFLVRAEVGAEFRPTPDWTVALAAETQWSDDALPAFEEFAAGTYSIGRGYNPGAVLGDSGIGLSAEIRYGSLAPKSANKPVIQPYVFTDMAWAWNEDPSRKGLNPDRLWSAGGGIRAVLGSKLQGDFSVAVPLKRPDFATSRGDVRLLFSLTARLLPWSF